MAEEQIDKSKMRLGDVLTHKGFVTPQELQRAFKQQKETGLRLGEQLIALEMVTEENILECLCWQQDLSMKSMAGVEISPSAYVALPEDYILANNVLPIDASGNTLVVVHSDPLNLNFIADEVSHRTGKRVEIFAATENSIKSAIESYKKRMKEFLPLLDALQAEPVDKGNPLHETIHDVEEATTPIIAFTNIILRTGIMRKATDIYIEPKDDTLKVRYRIDGIVQDAFKFPAEFDKHKEKVVARLKTMASLDISEKRLPQDGRFRGQLKGKLIDCRVSVLPTIDGEKVVLRVLFKDRLDVSLKNAGLSNYSMRLLTNLLEKPHGLMLVTGPTGSGKTTTLYASLAYMYNPTKSVVTVEDPVEYEISHYSQAQVNAEVGLTFASLLRSILRQAPDIILVGEIRDSETAKIACEAAMTGHYVMSTLHSNDSASSVMRLTEIGVDKFLVSSVLIGSIAQRLVRRLCAKCRRPVGLDEELQEFANRYKLKTQSVYEGKGCGYCMGSGYVGRLGIHEILQNTVAIQELITQGGTPLELVAAARQSGFINLREDALLKVIQGFTDMKQVRKVTG